MVLAATLAAAGAFCIGSASVAYADEAAPANESLGSPANIVNGTNIQAWTVSNLKQSTDAIPYQAHGTLWEATATDEAVQGGVTPLVSNFNATSPGGQTYRALYQVATAQGVNPSSINQGQKTSGKVYFDVTGDNPNTVVYRDAGGHDFASWVQSTGPRRGGGTAGPAGTGAPTSVPAIKPAAPAGNAAPTTGSAGTPIPVGSQGTPAPAGTPSPAATPSPAGNPASPANNPAAPAAAPGTPAPAGAPGSPAPAASPNAPAATAPAGGQTPTGSQGTPGSAGTPFDAPVAPTPAAPAPGQTLPAGNGTPAPGTNQGSTTP
jgi:hypothetical protein